MTCPNPAVREVQRANALASANCCAHPARIAERRP